jgi:single-strand DNA-binding protein
MLNKAILVGRLGADPDMRYTAAGTPVVNMRLATTEYRKDKDGEKTESTEWHNIVAFGKLADNAKNILQKGRLIYCEGKIQTRKWEDRDGNGRQSTDIIISTFIALERSGNGVPPSASVPSMGNDAASGEIIDDDIPF